MTGTIAAVAGPLSFHADVGVFDVVFVVLAATIFLLGTAITVIAFQGYRRNQSRPMLFMAIGFGLIILVQVVVGLVYALVPVSERLLQTVTQLSNVIGLLCILYALRMDA